MNDGFVFSQYIKRECKNKDISYRNLCDGLMTPSTINRFFGNKTEIDFDLKNRLLGRLGYDYSGFEKYVFKADYEKLKHRDKILKNIKLNELLEAECELQIYKELYYNNNDIDKQFCLAMELQIGLLTNRDNNELFSLAQNALMITVPNLEQINEKNFSPEEINLFVETVALNSLISDEEKIRRLLAFGKQIKTKETSTLFKAKVFSKITYSITSLYSDKIISKKEKDKLVFICKETIEMLRDSGYMFYLYDILLFIQKMEGQCKSRNNNNDGNKFLEILDDIDCLCENVLKASHSNNFTHFYDCYYYFCIGDAIRKRRKMLKMTMSELAEGITTERTVSRLENNKSKTVNEITRKLLNRVGLDSEYSKLRIVTDDVNVINDYTSCIKMINAKHYDEAQERYTRVFERLDLSIETNFFEMGLKRLTLLKGLKRIDNEEYSESVLALLQNKFPKLSFNGIKPDDELFFTHQELNAIYNAARFGGGNKQILFDLLYAYTKSSDENELAPDYLWLLNCVADAIGNYGNYEKSIEISKKILTNSVLSHNSTYIHESLYGILWNKMQTDKENDKEFYIKILDTCKLFSIYCKDEYSVLFYNKKINEMRY